MSSSNSVRIVSVSRPSSSAAAGNYASHDVCIHENQTVRHETIPEALEDIIPEISEMPGDEWDHRRHRPKVAFGQRTATFPCSLEEFLHRHSRLLQSCRFAAIPLTRPHRGSKHPHDRSNAWKAHWLHRGSCFDMPSELCDVAYIRTSGEWAYQIDVATIRHQFLGSATVTSPSLSLVAFPRPFTGFHMFNRQRRGDDAAFESRMRYKNSSHFVTYDNVEYFAVPKRVRDELYVRVESSWKESWEAPRFLCVPTPPYMAYHSSDWLSEQSSDRKALSKLILRSEWTVLCFICFLDAAKYGVRFKTGCMDRRIYQEDSEGRYGRLFHLPYVVVETIKIMGVSDILEGTCYKAEDAQRALDALKRVDWKKLPVDGFAFYDFTHDRFLDVPGVPWPYAHSADRSVSEASMICEEEEPTLPTTAEGLLGTDSNNECHSISEGEPVSPSYEPPGLYTAADYFSTEERDAFWALQQECQLKKHFIPQTVTEAFRMATSWVRNSSRMEQIEDKAAELLKLTKKTESGILHLLDATHRTEEENRMGGVGASSKRPRTS